MDAADPDDVRRTRDLSIDELDRMQRLVDELMVLAKARQPDFVRLTPTGVAELLFSVFDKVTTLGTGAGRWTPRRRRWPGSTRSGSPRPWSSWRRTR